jgi:hypothetical protein
VNSRLLVDLSALKFLCHADFAVVVVSDRVHTPCFVVLQLVCDRLDLGLEFFEICISRGYVLVALRNIID